MPSLSTSLTARTDANAMAGASLLQRLAKPDQSATDRAQLARQSDFASTLASQQQAASGAQPTAEQQARRAAEDFVSVAFVQPILKALRDGNKAPPPFGPGPGEKQFRTFADAQMARNLVRASNWNIVQAVERQMLRTTDRVQPGSPADLRRREEARALEAASASDPAAVAVGRASWPAAVTPATSIQPNAIKPTPTP